MVVGPVAYMYDTRRPYPISWSSSLSWYRCLHTTVSVTKGIGRAELGGCCGLALFVGGKGGMLEKPLMLDLDVCRRICDRVARRLDLAMNSIVVSGRCVLLPKSYG